MFEGLPPAIITWKRLELDPVDRHVISESEDKNLITNLGRDLLFYCLFGLPGSGSVLSVAAGASSTAAAVSDTRLTYEHILNGTRKLITDTDGNTLNAADVVSDPVTISSVNYYRKVVCQAEWLSGDANNNHQFAEYALMTTLACPGTPTGTSGVMFNHYIDPAPIIKSSGNIIQIQITIRM